MAQCACSHKQSCTATEPACLAPSQKLKPVPRQLFDSTIVHYTTFVLSHTRFTHFSFCFLTRHKASEIQDFSDFVLLLKFIIKMSNKTTCYWFSSYILYLSNPFCSDSCFVYTQLQENQMLSLLCFSFSFSYDWFKIHSFIH